MENRGKGSYQLQGIYIYVYCLSSQFSKKISTPEKYNIDTKNGQYLKGVPFSKPSFWVSMLVFGGVQAWELLHFFFGHVLIQSFVSLTDLLKEI